MSATITDIDRARELLAGGSMLIAGGDFRPEYHEAIQTELGLRELRWCETSRKAASVRGLAVLPDLRCVVVLIRYIRHHGHDTVQRWCRRNGVPLVTITGGYSPNQIAHQIVRRFGR